MRILQENKWHAVYVSSRQEKTACRILTEKGITAYLPLVKTLRQWSDRKKTVMMPLLNGYLFVFAKPFEFLDILQTKGIVNFVKSEGKVAVIREEEMESLRRVVDLDYQLEVRVLEQGYREGEQVKITSGILKGVEGYVLEKREGKFIDVMLGSIGQSIRVKLPEHVLTLV
jgi:transcriptional antiterminator RfaH